MTNTLSDEVISEITLFISQYLVIETPKDINGDCNCIYPDDCMCEMMEITFAVNKTGDMWAYQTGDNSFTGGCYGLPIWYATCISHEEDRKNFLIDVLENLNDYLRDYND